MTQCRNGLGICGTATKTDSGLHTIFQAGGNGLQIPLSPAMPQSRQGMLLGKTAYGAAILPMTHLCAGGDGR